MKIVKKNKKDRRWPAIAGACLALLAFTGQASAQEQRGSERIALWYEGTVVSGLNKANDKAVANVPNDLPAHVLQPFYFIITPGMGRVQDPVIGLVPGDMGYTGWWNWSAMLDFSGRDLATDPYTSVGEISAATCPIDGFPGNIGACVVNGTPLINVTGFGGATDFVFNIPIVHSAPEPAACQ